MMETKMENFIDYSMKFIMALCVAVIFGMLGLGAFYLVNGTGLEKHITSGIVSDVSFRREHEETRVMSTGKTTTVRTDNVPDKWFLNVVSPEGEDWISILHAPWDWEEKGRQVRVIYTRGRLSHSFSVEAIDKP